MQHVIYTDGACRVHDTKCGGVGIVICTPGKPVDTYSFHQCATTNQRMELMAVIAALAPMPLGADVLVKSDSEYVVRGHNENWRTKTNHDLWQELRGMMKGRNATLTWIPRCSEPDHVKADQLAKEASRRCV